MVVTVRSLGLSGISGYEVSVECFLSGGLPAFDVVGLPDAAVRESRERVRAAIKACGARFPVSRITVNLAPAGQRKEGTVYDLPILLGILTAAEELKGLPEDAAFLGERICTDVAFLNSGVVGVQGKLSDIKTRYRSEEYQLETGNDTGMLILQQTFPNMQQIGRNQLVFCEGDYTVFDILRFIADRHIALLKLERAEPTLESLFMEVVKK